MKTNEFKNFYNNLSMDMETYECFGFAFLQMTEKQIDKVVEMYKSKGLYKIENRREHFGTQFQWSRPIQ